MINLLEFCSRLSISLETSVEREKDVQHIDVHGEFEKLIATLLVMRAFPNFPGASRGCAYKMNSCKAGREGALGCFHDPTEVFGII